MIIIIDGFLLLTGTMLAAFCAHFPPYEYHLATAAVGCMAATLWHFPPRTRRRAAK